MKTIFKVVCIFLLGGLNLLFRVYVVQKMFIWFVTPFWEFATPSLLHCLGLITLLQAMTFSLPDVETVKKQSVDIEFQDAVAEAASYIIPYASYSLTILFWGYLAHFFM